jgi:hypothetical protein
MFILAGALLCLSSVFSVLAFYIAVQAKIEVEAFKRSTHNVVLVDPTKQAFDAVTPEQNEKAKQDFQEFKNIM